MPETKTTRRELITDGALSSLMTYALLQTLFANDLFAEESREEAGHWLAGVDAISKDLRGEAISQVEWQKRVEALFDKVPLDDLRRAVNFDKIKANAKFNPRGETAYRAQLPDVEGIPKRLVFGHQIFGMTKGRSVVPHGHQKMATSFQVLDGQFRGRHFDRVEDQAKHMIVRPTIDRAFGPGESSSISDHKDNVHWFEATTDTAFIFNIHVLNLPSDEFKRGGRVYIDPAGEKIADGLIRAPKISHKESLKLYG